MSDAMPPLPSELDLSQEQLRAIGCVTVESVRLDVLIDRTIWLISESSIDAGKTFTDRLDTGAKLHLLRALAVARIADEKSRETLERLCDDIAGVLARKNVLINFRFHRPVAAGPVASGSCIIGAREVKAPRPDKAMILARRLFKLQGELRRFFLLHTKDFLAAPDRSA